MSIAKSYSGQLVGLQLLVVTIEVDTSHGLHAFSVVGLGDRAVEESKDRISAAIKNTGYVSPKQRNQKVVISLAPADVRKEGPSFELAMALSYLSAVNEISFNHDGRLFLGELSLEGRVRKVSGLLPILCQAPSMGFTEAFVPRDNIHEASLARDIKVYAVSTLREAVEHLSGIKPLEPVPFKKSIDSVVEYSGIDMHSVRGNETAKRGLEIAAAGAHNLIMCGPPGTGKTMLAQAFTSILPPLSYEQSVEVTGIHSAARTLGDSLISKPPFRSPHHTASYPSIVGGGSIPKPGEITLAHRGVLFMDEFSEFDRSVIEALRQPLEDRVITISRVRGVITFPAQCILIASMNPCPCGKGKGNGCTCPAQTMESYRRKISGPITDRFDLWLNVNKVDYERLAAKSSSEENSETIRTRVIKARDIQSNRFKMNGIAKCFNSEMSADDIEKYASIEDGAREVMALSAKKLELSGRAFHRVIKVARTIADLADSRNINKEHLLEALQYRRVL